jgi:hypothetical protein
MDKKTNTAIRREKQVLALAVANTAISCPGERASLIFTPKRRSADGESRRPFCPAFVTRSNADSRLKSQRPPL